MLTLISRALGWVEHAESRKQSFGGFFRRFAPLLGRRSLLGERVQHLGTLPLTTQSSLAVIRFNNETLLIGVTTQNMTLIARAPDEGHWQGNVSAESSTMPRVTPHEPFGAEGNPIA
jgi:flagellar biogenesis protein FliO